MKKKRIISLLLALLMGLGMFPSAAFATEAAPCAVCGAPDCATGHVYCEVCSAYDCGVDHSVAPAAETAEQPVSSPVPCTVCGTADCGISHVYCELCSAYDCGQSHEAQQPEAPALCESCGAEPCVCETEPTVCESCGAEPCVCEAELSVCEICGAEPCVCQLSEEPDYDEDIGKYARLNADCSEEYITGFDGVQLLYFPRADFPEGLILIVEDWHVDEAANSLWYSFSAHEGSLPEAVPDGCWLFQKNIDSEEPDVFEFITISDEDEAGAASVEIPACPDAPTCWGTANGMALNNHQDGACTRKEFVKNYVLSNTAQQIAAQWSSFTEDEQADIMAMVESYTGYAGELKALIEQGTPTQPELCPDCGNEVCSCEDADEDAPQEDGGDAPALCAICNSEPCICVPLSSTGPTSPDYSAYVGKYAVISDVSSYYDVTGNPDSLAYGDFLSFAGEEFLENTIFEILGWYWEAASSAVWFNVKFHSGGVTEAAAIDWPADPWVLHTYVVDGVEDQFKSFTFVTIEEPEQPENPCGCCEACTGEDGCECECEDCTFKSDEPEQPEEPDTPDSPVLSDPESGVMVSLGTLPENLSLSVKPADVSSQLNAFGVSAAKLAFGLDISILTADNSQYQPEGAVVKVPVSAAPGTKIGLLHTHNGVTRFMGLTDVLADGTVEFYTDGFSEFAGFTVDFHYNGVDFSIAGKTSILLSELFAAMGIAEDASQAVGVSFSDPSLVTVTQQGSDWLLTSLVAFSTNETLIVSFYDGHTIVIDVTDASNIADYNYVSGTTYTIPEENDDYIVIWIDKDQLPVTVNLQGHYTYRWRLDSADPNSDYASFSSNGKTATITVKSGAPVGYKYSLRNNNLTISGRARGIVRVIELVTFRYKENGIVTSTTAWPSNTANNVIGKWSIEDTSADTEGRTATFTISGTKPAAPGYTFVNWSYKDWRGDVKTVSPGGTVRLDGDSINGDYVDFTANWNLINYKITYDENGGQAVSDQNYNVETNLTLSAAPKRDGYTFTGWKLASNVESWKAGTFSASQNLGQKNYGNITLVAQWARDEYTISYNLADGTLPSGKTNPTSYNSETAAFTLNNPVREGYTFAGWTGTGLSSASTTVTVAKGSTGNRSYTATWTPISYAVSFNGNGATSGSMSNQSFTFGTAQNLTANAFKLEYTVSYNTNGGDAVSASTAEATFNGWEDHGTIVYQGVTYGYPSFDVPYYANSSISEAYPNGDIWGNFGYNKYRIMQHYVQHGMGEGRPLKDSSGVMWLYPDRAEVNNMSSTAGATVPLYANWTLGSITLPSATKSGHRFDGWYSDSALSNKVGDAGASYTPSSNVTLYAKWTPTQVTVTWKNGDSTLETDTVDYNGSATYNGTAPTKASANGYSYSFAGWDKGTNGTVSNVTTDTIVNALFSQTAINYRATFDANGGTVSPPSAIFNVTTGISLPSPEREGYTHKWKITSADVGSSWHVGQEYSVDSIAAGNYGNVTFTAQWTAKTDASYTVHYYLKDTNTKLLDDKSVEAVTFGQSFEEEAPDIEGYTVVAPDTQTVTAGYSDNEITFYYTKNSYTVSYKYDGTAPANAPAAPAETSASIGDSINVAEAPSLEHYSFSGWTTSDVTVTDGEFTMPGKNISFIGSWTAVDYTITYDLDGGALAEGVTNPVSYNIESEPITLNNPTKTGYTFAGWTGTDLTEAAETVTIAKGSTGDRSYTATWTENEATITYTVETVDGQTHGKVKLNGSAVDASETTVDETVAVVTGTAIGAVAVPDAGYEFVGWYDEDGNKVSENAAFVPSKADDALWEDISYTAKFELALVDLTISTACADGTQSFIFEVVGVPKDSRLAQVKHRVILVGNDSVTLKAVPVGTYTVTEVGDWSWRHNEYAGHGPITVEQNTIVPTFDFGAAENNKWLSGCSTY